MLSTPHKRFAWARSERFSEFTFFRTLLQRRPRKTKRVASKESIISGRKSAPWTPWLWIK